MIHDRESHTTADDHAALRLWLRMLTCTTLIEQHIRGRLRETHDMTLPRFDVLAQLARAPDGMRMRELSQRMMVTGGNITGLVTQLEAEGLLARSVSSSDRRARRVKLTGRGQALFARMARAHEGWIVTLMHGLNARETSELHVLLGKLKQAAGSASA